MRVQTEESIDARSSTFLIGAGGLLTASFVNRAAFSEDPARHWCSPARKPGDPCVYRQEKWNDYGGEWRVTLGPDQPFRAPTWREHLGNLGHPRDA
jgi:hypothetical protein